MRGMTKWRSIRGCRQRRGLREKEITSIAIDEMHLKTSCALCRRLNNSSVFLLLLKVTLECNEQWENFSVALDPLASFAKRQVNLD
mmetsp:Transcript_34369/g.107777  ORF Transcript_34369/g.107777 Transcript_34369/m.107777 type:complete len:86 (-) Transcript_34369:643-900(-)